MRVKVMTLNVLHLNAPTSLAGAERVILTYFENHTLGEITPSLLSYVNQLNSNNDFTREAEKQGINLHRIMLGGYRGLPRQLIETLNIIRKLGIHVIHSHGYRSDIIGFLASRLARVPIVSTVHGWTPVTRRVSRYERIDRLLLRHFDHVICVSRPLYDNLKGTVSANRLTMLPNAVTIKQMNSDSFKNREKVGRTILFAGRLSKEKGVDVLLNAYAQYNAEGGAARLIILGDGPLRGEYAQLVSKLGIDRNVTFLGHRNDVFSYYCQADVFVLPSRSEGLPMALLEAMAFGIPVVATNVGGIPDVVCDGISGKLVPPDVPEALTAAFHCLFGNYEAAILMGSHGKNKICRDFSAEPWARKIENIYQNVSQLGLAPRQVRI